MSIAKRVARNSGVVLAGNLIIRSISILVIIYLARYLSVEDFGKYGFVIAYVAFFAVAANLSMPTVLVREMSKAPDSKSSLVNAALTLASALSVIAILLCLSIVIIGGYPADIRTYVVIVSVTLLFDSVGSILSTIFETELRMEFDMAAKALDRLMSAIVILYVILTGGNLLDVLLVIVVSRGVALVIILLAARRFVPILPRIDLALWRFLLVQSSAILLLTIFSTVYQKIDRVLLQAMAGDVAVGYYTAAYRLIDTFRLAAGAFVVSLFPLLASYHSSSIRLFERIYRIGFRYLVSGSVLLAVFGSIMAEDIIVILFSEKYLPAVAAFRILLSATPFMFVTILYSRLLIAVGLHKKNIVFAGVSALVNIAVNILLIPQYDLVGAGIATLVSYALVPGLGLLDSSTRVYSARAFSCFWRPLLASGPGIILALVSSPAVAVVAGIPAFAVLLFFIGGIGSDDFVVLRRIISREPEDLEVNDGQ